MSNIAVIGTGYVGLTTGVCFADLGNHVTCVEINLQKLDTLRSGKTPIYEPGLQEVLERNLRAQRLQFTDDYAVALADAQFIFITVGTPMGANGAADLGQVKAAARSIGEHLTHHAIIIDKSTVPVGTGDMVGEVIRSHLQQPDLEVHIVSNPEFLREGSALSDFFRPDRVVLGASRKPAAQLVAELHEPLNAPIIITDLRTAEMIKYASNAFLATRISFINEIAQICEKLGADVKEVARGMGADKRIGPHFLDAGVGYGGSCFPKDVLALHHMAASSGWILIVMPKSALLKSCKPICQALRAH
jgi:UDPglucose 6-dehydrogenase